MLDYPKRSNEASKVPGPGFAPMFGALVPPAYLRSLNTAAFRAGDEITQSWFKFVGDRIAKDAELPRQLTHCRNANDLVVLCGEYWQQTAKDYAAEYSKIATASWTAGQSIWGATGAGAGGKAQQ